MERKVTKLENCHVQVDVVVDEKVWQDAQQKALNKLAAKVKVDGFRPGKAPIAMAKKYIDPAKLYDEALNIVLPIAYRDALENEKLEPFAQPKVDVLKLSENQLEVRFVIITSPEVTLGQYKGLKVGKPNVEVTDKDVDDEINKLREQNASLILKEGEAALGDTLVFDFVGSIDGVEFEGGAAQNYSLELGSGQFIPGFEDQLVGTKAGEHKDVNVTFPEQYGAPELAGKAAVFACDVHEVKEKKFPELDDEFVKDLGIKDVETVAALKENKKNELLVNKTNQAKSEYLNKLYDEIAKGSKIAIAEEMIESDADRNMQDMERRMQQSGLTLDQYLGYIGQKKEDFVAKLREDAKRNITNYFMLEAIGAAEKITVSDEDVDFEIAKIASENDTTVEEINKVLDSRNQRAQFKNNLRLTRIEDFLYENND